MDLILLESKGLNPESLVRKRIDIATNYVVGMVATFSKKKDYQTFVDAAHTGASN
jgi:prolyl-tRNA editing enzyme YbaK/EbsC (Cys-tRNA(Pro) deacylase)